MVQLNSVRHCLRRLCISAHLQYAHASVLLYTFMREIQKSNTSSVLTRYILLLLRLKLIVFCTICDGGLPIYYIYVLYISH